jgi:MFS family permease
MRKDSGPAAESIVTQARKEPEPAVREGFGRLLLGDLAPACYLVCLGVALQSLSFFIVLTALPSTVADVGGAHLLAWVSTAFMIAAITSGAAGGLIKARLGTRTTLFACISVFALGTLVTASASGMLPILFGRTIQGLGEGLIIAISFTLVQELFPKALVARVMALKSIVWSGSAVLGPLGAGLILEYLGWRYVFAAVLVPAAVFTLLIVPAVPRRIGTNAGGLPPFGRMAALGLGILLIGLTAQGFGIAGILGLTSLALFLFVTVVRYDRRQTVRLFPLAAFGFSTPVGLGYWMILFMPLASAAFHVFIPLMMQHLHGLSPTAAGYFATLTTFSWTAAALLVSRIQNQVLVLQIIRQGPLNLAMGCLLAWTGFVQELVPLIALGLVLSGSGFGLAWAFMVQALAHHAASEEKDQTTGLIPVIQSCGYAIGAAVAGLSANLSGLGDPVTAPALARAAEFVFLPPLIFAALAVLAGLAFVRSLRRGPKIAAKEVPS